MSGSLAALVTPLALGLGLLAYVLPVDRVVLQLAQQRAGTPSLRVDATLEGIGEDWPQEVSFELHAEMGFRVSSEAGPLPARWVFSGGRASAGTVLPAPPWIPDLEILMLRDPESLLAWLDRLGVDPEQSELARCGEFDCYVLGGRGAGAQVWIEKDRFEVLGLRETGGAGVEYGGWKDWSKLRFPAEVRIYDAFGTIGTLSVVSVERSGPLGEADFSSDWVDALRGASPAGVLPASSGVDSASP